MKKTFVLVIMLCIFCTASESCSISKPVDKKQSLESEKGSEMNPSVVIETPPDRHSYSFASYQDVINALTQKGSDSFSALRKEQANYGTVYEKTLSKFESEEMKIAVPQYKGMPISLRDRDGYDNISLMTCELYQLPWLWYHCVVENRNLDIKISYLNVIESTEIQSAESYYAVLRLIAPNAPSPDNYDRYASYKSIYEEKVTLQNGVVVTAMISELKNDSKMYVMFYYDNMLITLYADSGLFTETFFRSFGVVPYQNHDAPTTFQSYSEYDGIDFDVEEFIEKAKGNGNYVFDHVPVVIDNATNGKKCEFWLNPEAKLSLWGIVYDSAENARNGYQVLMKELIRPCLTQDASLVRIDNIVIGSNGAPNSFKQILEEMLCISQVEGTNRVLFNGTKTARIDANATAEELVQLFQKKGFIKVFHQEKPANQYVLINSKNQSLEMLIANDVEEATYMESISYWATAYENTKIVYSYQNGTLIAIVGATVDPEILLME